MELNNREYNTNGEEINVKMVKLSAASVRLTA